MAADDLSLDEIQAAEAEAAGVGYEFDFGGDHFTLPGLLPVAYLFDVATLGFKDAFSGLLGDDAAKFWAHKPGRDVIAAIDQRMAKHYGLGKAGNSAASHGSSKNGTGRSRPTSSTTTS